MVHVCFLIYSWISPIAFLYGYGYWCFWLGFRRANLLCNPGGPDSKCKLPGNVVVLGLSTFPNAFCKMFGVYGATLPSEEATMQIFVVLFILSVIIYIVVRSRSSSIGGWF
jgi:hypothetical protein